MIFLYLFYFWTVAENRSKIRGVLVIEKTTIQNTNSQTAYKKALWKFKYLTFQN